MRNNKPLVFKGAIWLSCAAFLSVSVPAPILEDTNSDRRVDVLDVQYVIAKILVDPGQNNQADVNCDGSIDILDLQAVVKKACEYDAEEEGEPLERDEDKAVPNSHPRVPVDAQFVVHVKLADWDEASHRNRPDPRPLVICTPQVRLYINCLTAHAPPALG